MNLESTLWIAGIAAETALVVLLFYRRVWRLLPVFCTYCAWVLLCDVGNYSIRTFYLSSYLTTYLTETIVDSALEFAVVVELAWSILRPLRNSLSRSALIAVAVLIALAWAAIWPFSGVHSVATLSPEWQIQLRVQQTSSILRIVFFLVLAACSQLLSISWRDRELQVATGLGLYSFISLAVEILHTHAAMQHHYRLLDQFAAAGYLCSLFYWVLSFAQQEAQRREFSPQMQNVLLAVAGAARNTRIDLSESATGKRRRR